MSSNCWRTWTFGFNFLISNLVHVPVLLPSLFEISSSYSEAFILASKVITSRLLTRRLFFGSFRPSSSILYSPAYVFSSLYQRPARFSHTMAEPSSTPKEQPWHAAFPAPKAEPDAITKEQMLTWLQEGKVPGKDFVLVDLRRNDYEACVFLLSPFLSSCIVRGCNGGLKYRLLLTAFLPVHGL